MGRQATKNNKRPPTPKHSSIDSISNWIWVIVGGHILGLLTVVLALTPLTFQLDDIKTPIYMTAGPLLMLIALVALWFRWVPTLPRPVGWGLAGYGAVLIVSTLASEFKWAGWYEILFVWTAYGFFLSAFCAGAYPRTSRFFTRYLVLQLLATNLIGFFMFDLFGDPNHGSAVAWVFQSVYGNFRPSMMNPLFNLLNTLQSADGAMQSTILSRDFYAAICVLYLPFALCLGMDPDSESRPLRWRVVGIVTSLLTIVSIFFCQSKGEWIFAVVVVGFFFAMYGVAGRGIRVHRRHLAACLGGILLLLLTLGWMRSPTLFGQLKTLAYSFESRAIIWTGSWEIWKDFPLLGGGPGTFRIYFPQYRTPDYFDHEISNVTLFSHNYFMDLISETGIIGAICFCFLLGALLLGGIRWALNHPDPHLRLRLVAAVAGVIGIFGSNLSSPNGRWVIGASSMWTVMGLLTGMWAQARASMPPQTTEAPAEAPVHQRISARARSNPLGGPLRWCAYGAWAAVALAMLPLASGRGIHKFNSARHYAQGFAYRDNAYNKIENPVKDREILKVLEVLETAANEFRLACEIDPYNMSGYYQNGSVYTTLNQIYQKYAIQLDEQGRSIEAKERRRTANIRLSEAKKTYEILGKFWPDYAEIHYNLGIVYHRHALALLKLPKVDLAAQRASGLAVLEGESSESYERLALEHLERMGELSNKTDVAMLQGGNYRSMGYTQKAHETYRTASRRDPENKDLAINYYDSAQQAGDFEGMAEAMGRIWALEPTDNSLIDHLLEICLENQLDQTLEGVLERLEALNPIDPRIYEGWVRLALQRGQSELLLKALRRYNKCHGDKLELYGMGIQAAQALGWTDEQRELTELLINIDKDGLTTYGQQRTEPVDAMAPTTGTPSPSTDRSASPPRKGADLSLTGQRPLTETE